MRIRNGGPQQELDEIVLFPFDDHSLPFQSGLELQLNGYRHGCAQTRIVLHPGEKGSPDSECAIYYGSVQRVGEELWMWYLGQGADEDWFGRVCLATSRDGYNWEKPDLELVEYRGNRHNNLVDLNRGSHHVQSCVVFHDPEDEERRFKMAFQCRHYHSCFATAYSADGLIWREYPNNPVGRHLEMAGGTRLDGVYYLSGQGGKHPPPGRQLVTHASYDFEHWSESFCVGLNRADRRHREFGGSSGRQVHLGAAMWNRGNVVVGFYGMWNGHPSNDRRLVTMDLGLAVTSDGLHYREPIPDYPIVSAAEDGWEEPPVGNTLVNFPTLIQGQGFENMGEETLFWYAPWPEQASDGVRVASWPRDRLGYYSPFSKDGGHCASAPVDLGEGKARLFLNVDGIGEFSTVTVELLDEQFQPLAGYGVADGGKLEAGGLKQSVRWGEREFIEADGPVRVRVNFLGVRPEDIGLYAVYLEKV